MKDFIRLMRDPGSEAAGTGGGAAAAPASGTPAVAPAPAAGPSVTAPGSASTTLDVTAPLVKPAEPPAAGTPPTFEVPEAYKDKPYLKGVDSQEKLFAMLDGAQKLIGQPRGPVKPADTAPQAEKDAYYEALGVPKTAAEYKFEGEDKTDPAVLPKLKDMFKKNGIAGDAAKGLWNDFQTIVGDIQKAQGAAAAQADVDFDKLAASTFGVNRDKILAQGKELITANMSPAMKAAVDKLPNESLIVLADVLNNINKKYIKPEGAPPHGPTTTGTSPDELRNKAKSLMEKQSKVPPMSVEFDTYQREIDSIYDSIRKGAR